MSDMEIRIERMYQTLAMERTALNQLELRVESLEQWVNQLSMLLTTHGDATAEKKKQEL